MIGQCVTLMLRSIWSNYNDLPNTMPKSSGTETRDFVSFFLFWLFSLPALWFPVHKIRHLFTVKAYFTPIAAIVFFAWAIRRADGLGPIIDQGSKLQGSALAWGVIKGIMSSIANFATLIVNDPDFARFATKPKDALWSQLFTIPIGFAVTSFIGIIVSSSSSVIYNEPIWNPLELLGKFLEDASSGERFGIFVISTGFALAQLGTNIAANSVSAGTDMTALFPRFINIRRGSYICALVGLAMCPVRISHFLKPGPQMEDRTDFLFYLTVAPSIKLQQLYDLPLRLLCLSLLHRRSHDLRLLRRPQGLLRHQTTLQRSKR